VKKPLRDCLFLVRGARQSDEGEKRELCQWSTGGFKLLAQAARYCNAMVSSLRVWCEAAEAAAAAAAAAVAAHVAAHLAAKQVQLETTTPSTPDSGNQTGPSGQGRSPARCAAFCGCGNQWAERQTSRSLSDRSARQFAVNVMAMPDRWRGKEQAQRRAVSSRV
jgi:hypothetical protein